MKMVSVQEAVGMVLCHDITQIIPGKFKGRAFKKGHIVTFEDIPKLLDIGKQNLYVWEINNELIHEDDAALRIARSAAGGGIALTEPKEGKVNLVAKEKGLLKVNTEALYSINELEEVMFATIHTNQIVEKDKILAGTRIIPLVIKDDKIRNIEAICRMNYPLLEVKPFKAFKVGVVTTGSEVYHGRIEDKFGPVVTKKMETWGSYVFKQIFVSDSTDMIVDAINQLLREGAEMITVTGGMSVDPDDLTPAGIRAAGGRIVTYGAPTLPGAMFMVAI
ncbi:hypothetical protein N752_28880 [Desulforamulus aquiferis]|nr:hypothetical protein N752_28880 [Desulforamulus aquiferis]